jgi:dihydroorotase-like cyclic amidohydrolase
MLPLMVTALIRGDISFKQFYAVMHENPKRILRSRGFEFGFGVGGRADFAIVDTSETYAIDPTMFHSKAQHSPFSGMEVEAQVVETWVRGKNFFSNGSCTKEAKGALLSKME